MKKGDRKHLIWTFSWLLPQKVLTANQWRGRTCTLAVATGIFSQSPSNRTRLCLDFYTTALWGKKQKKTKKNLSDNDNPLGLGLLLFVLGAITCLNGQTFAPLVSPHSSCCPRVSIHFSSSLVFDTDSELCSLCRLPSWVKEWRWLTHRGFPQRQSRRQFWGEL